MDIGPMNRCPKCRYKRTVIKDGRSRFCELCKIQWVGMYLRELQEAFLLRGNHG